MAITVCCASAFGLGDVRGQDARMSIYADSVSVGDQFFVTLSVDRPADAEAFFPVPERGDSLLGDLEILATERARPQAREAAGIVSDSVRYLVTTFALDSAIVPPLEVHIVEEGDTTIAISPSALIPVRSIVDENAEDVRDIAPIVPFRPVIWPWVLAGLLLATIGLAAFFLYRRRLRGLAGGDAAMAEEEVPPFNQAMRRLDQLEEFDLETETEVKPFYVELADILRTYLERQTDIPALETTTRDLLRRLERRQSSGFPSTAVALIRTVLEVADLAKFADVRPPSTTGRQSLHDARRAIEDVEESVRPKEEMPVTEQQ